MSRNEELIMLFQKASGDIEFAKQSQWRTTYYSLLAYAALVGVTTLKGPETVLLQAVLQFIFPCIAAILVAIFSWIDIGKCHDSMVTARKRMEISQQIINSKYFDSCFNEGKSEYFTSYDNQVYYRNWLRLFSIIGAAFTFLFVTVEKGSTVFFPIFHSAYILFFCYGQ